jgi:hypothetical protein
LNYFSNINPTLLFKYFSKVFYPCSGNILKTGSNRPIIYGNLPNHINIFPMVSKLIVEHERTLDLHLEIRPPDQPLLRKKSAKGSACPSGPHVLDPAKEKLMSFPEK